MNPINTESRCPGDCLFTPYYWCERQWKHLVDMHHINFSNIVEKACHVAVRVLLAIPLAILSIATTPLCLIGYIINQCCTSRILERKQKEKEAGQQKDDFLGIRFKPNGTYTVNLPSGPTEYYRPFHSLGELMHLGLKIGGNLYGPVIASQESSQATLQKGHVLSCIAFLKCKEQAAADYQSICNLFNIPANQRTALRSDLPSNPTGLSLQELRKAQKDAFRKFEDEIRQKAQEWGCESVRIPTAEELYRQYGVAPRYIAEANYIFFHHRPVRSSIISRISHWFQNFFINNHPVTHS